MLESWVRSLSGSFDLMFSPAWDALEHILEVGFIYPFVVIDTTDIGSATVGATAQMLDMTFVLPIPDAESLPFYRSVSKLACPACKS